MQKRQQTCLRTCPEHQVALDNTSGHVRSSPDHKHHRRTDDRTTIELDRTTIKRGMAMVGCEAKHQEGRPKLTDHVDRRFRNLLACLHVFLPVCGLPPVCAQRKEHSHSFGRIKGVSRRFANALILAHFCAVCLLSTVFVISSQNLHVFF